MLGVSTIDNLISPTVTRWAIPKVKLGLIDTVLKLITGQTASFSDTCIILLTDPNGKSLIREFLVI